MTLALAPEFWPNVGHGATAIVLSTIVGIALMVLGFFVIDWTTPGPLRQMVRAVLDSRGLSGAGRAVAEVSQVAAAGYVASYGREQELQAIFDASPVGIGVVDPQADYAFVKANQAVGQLLAYPVRHLLGKSGRDLGLWEDVDARARLYAALERDGLAEAEAWLRRGDGRAFLAALSTRTLPIAGQLRTVWVISDITELRRIEGELRELNAGLEQRVQRRGDDVLVEVAQLCRVKAEGRVLGDIAARTERAALTPQNGYARGIIPIEFLERFDQRVSAVRVHGIARHLEAEDEGDEEEPGEGVAGLLALAHQPGNGEERQEEARHREQVGHHAVGDGMLDERVVILFQRLHHTDIHSIPIRLRKRCGWGAIRQKTSWQSSPGHHTFTFRFFDGGVSKWPKDVDCKSIRLLPFTGSTPVSTTILTEVPQFVRVAGLLI